MPDPKFEVLFLEEAASFLEEQDEKARYKIIYDITRSRFSNDQERFKKLTQEIWEFRTIYKKMCFRMFAFWDKTSKESTLVVATHGIIKKSNKIPLSDLDKAERMRKLYFELKAKL
ncbi:MAG: type II toxin-antitoxin system RelE/ParE family toxin [Saprospiraceae bacterium]|nr:type II toxin-antitoxin system RelE/ParE family toxin [Saprospiraceae bacterium]